jgi:nucleoside-diphosphate kinase
MIKPDAVGSRKQGAILQHILDDGFELLAMRQLRLSKRIVEAFYAVHTAQPFFGDLVEFMSSGPVVVAALQRESAVARYRALIGTTNPLKAAPGSLRQLYGESIDRNAVHGSDSVENGLVEVSFFFAGVELG